MKPGDIVTRKWKPALGHGKVLHILGNRAVVQWGRKGKIKISTEDKKYLIPITSE